MTGRVRLAVEADLPAIDGIYNQAIAQHFCTAARASPRACWSTLCTKAAE
jgi:L-amino acid N-acyltransferase YncA